MTCRQFRSKIHAYLDGELSGAELCMFDQHQQECLRCRRARRELEWTKKMLRHRARLSQAAQKEVWQGINRRTNRSFTLRSKEFCRHVVVSFQDMNAALLWSKVSAIPITAFFFLLMLAQFSQLNPSSWSTPVVGVLPVVNGTTKPVVTSVPVRYGSTEIDGLMSAVWKIPYEDSLSLVAEIKPEGHAEVGNVLEYPKSEDLLKAVGLALRHSHFGTLHSRSFESRFVIYSFQKIDVYEDRQGL